MKVFHGVRPGQPPRPPSDARQFVRAEVKRSQGETMGWVLSCETGFSEVPIHFADEKATSSHAKNGEHEMDLAQSENGRV